MRARMQEGRQHCQAEGEWLALIQSLSFFQLETLFVRLTISRLRLPVKKFKFLDAERKNEETHQLSRMSDCMRIWFM